MEGLASSSFSSTGLQGTTSPAVSFALVHGEIELGVQSILGGFCEGMERLGRRGKDTEGHLTLP